jgi:hypothetical protein
MEVTETPLDQIIPYARNPRRNDGAVSKVAASLREYGWQQPIVVDEHGVIVVGHTRLLAAQHLGMESAPVHVATGLTPEQVKAYRIADNRVGEEAEWDKELLTLEVKELEALGFDLELTGLDPDEAFIMGNAEEPPAPEKEGHSYSEVFNIIISCANENEQEGLFLELSERGLKCQVQSL